VGQWDAPEIVKFITFALLSTFSESKSNSELLVPAAIVLGERDIPKFLGFLIFSPYHVGK